MANDIAALIILPITGFLENEILGKMLKVVAHVQARDKHILRLPRRNAASLWIARPEYAEPAEFIRTQRICRTRIAPGHVPGVLEKHGALVLSACLLLEHGAVKVSKLGLDELGHFSREG